jgi:hypothetical protein
MKYSIFGFSQEYAIKLQKEQDGKVKKLDATDLLILRDVADFMNRSKIIKYTIDDKVYFSIQYATILEDLPILDIKKQALSDRLDKMVLLNVLEKIVVKNQSGTFIAFRMGAEYEKLLYSCTNIQTAPTSSELQVQMYSTTNHNTNITNNSSTKQEKEDESSSKKEPTWRDDFNIFFGLVNSAKEQLLLDKKCKAKMELYYPNLNYELSLQKMVDDYWGTEEGWQKKKKSPKKDANIDMVKTLKNGFSRHYNRLYKRTTTQSFSTYIPQKVSDRAMDYISTLTVPVQTERDGIKYLIDGTFVEDGKRYYTHSIKGKMEISMGAVARPSEDWEWNSNMLTWEQDERKTTISDMLF